MQHCHPSGRWVFAGCVKKTARRSVLTKKEGAGGVTGAGDVRRGSREVIRERAHSPSSGVLFYVTRKPLENSSKRGGRVYARVVG